MVLPSSGNPTENLGCEACFYKRATFRGSCDFFRNQSWEAALLGCSRAREPSPPPLPSCTRTINARNRPPPVAGVSFGATGAPGKTLSAKDGISPESRESQQSRRRRGPNKAFRSPSSPSRPPPRRSAKRSIDDFVAAPQDPGGFASLEMSDRGEEVSAGERLLNQNCSAMRRWKLLPPIAADKGEGDAARLKRIGDASDRLAGEMCIQERAVDHLPVDGQKGISHTAGRADHGDACLLEHARDVERDQKFVFNYQHALCCHPCSRLFRQGQN